MAYFSDFSDEVGSVVLGLTERRVMYIHRWVM